MQTQAKTQYPSIAVFLFSWVVFAALYMALKSYMPAKMYAGILSYLVLIPLEIIATIYSIFLWEKATAPAKRIFGFFAISFFCIFASDVIYIIAYDILHTSLSPFLRLLLNLFYYGFLITQLLAWLSILPKMTTPLKKAKDLLIYVPLAFILITMLLLLFMIFELEAWHTHPSLSNFYDVSQAMLGFAAFVAAILCLATTKHKGVFNLALGFVVTKAGGLIMIFGVFAQRYGVGSFAETLWSLGLIFMVYGFLNFKNTKTYNTMPQTWSYGINSVRTQTVFWLFALFLIAAIIFLGANYLMSPKFFFLNKGALKALFPVLIAYSVITVILSKLFSIRICKPLTKIEGLISLYMKGEEPKEPLDTRFYGLQEFQNVEQFFLDSFKTLEDKHAAEKYISKMAAQVAHDIGSPLMAMQFALKQIEGLDSKSKATIHNVAGRINDLANYLLTEYKNPKIGRESELSAEFMPDLIDSIILEKKFLQENKKVKFHFNVEDGAYKTFIKTDKVEFQRALSNLINNSIEAISGKGEVTVNLKNEGSKALIEVIDTGAGIPQEIIDKITQEQFTYGKAQGTGLGLSYAIDRIKAWGGDYRITSKVGVGTTVTITLPKTDYPVWFQEQLTVPAGGNMVVLDSGEEIYNELAKQFDNVIHCQTVQELESRISQSGNNCYLIGTGLAGTCPEQLIKDLNIQQNAFLVTDKHSDKILMGICQSNGIKAIPRSYIEQIPVSGAEKLDNS